jgi:hypothetical protein
VPAESVYVCGAVVWGRRRCVQCCFGGAVGGCFGASCGRQALRGRRLRLVEVFKALTDLLSSEKREREKKMG